MTMTEAQRETYGCDDCRFLIGKRCKLWQVAVPDPHDSHCDSCQLRIDPDQERAGDAGRK